jgi:hypothetical protein
MTSGRRRETARASPVAALRCITALIRRYLLRLQLDRYGKGGYVDGHNHFYWMIRHRLCLEKADVFRELPLRTCVCGQRVRRSLAVAARYVSGSKIFVRPRKSQQPVVVFLGYPLTSHWPKPVMRTIILGVFINGFRP